MVAVERASEVGMERRLLARAGRTLGIAAYLLLWAFAGLGPRPPSDLDVFFLPAAGIAAHSPLLAYSLRVSGYQILYPNANGPLSLVPLTVLVALLARFGWLHSQSLSHATIYAVFALFNLLLAREGVAAIERLRGAPLLGPWRLLGFSAFALTPLVWLSLFAYGHIEHPMSLWLTLWGLRVLLEARPRRAGALLGLAVLARTTAVIYVLALVALLLATGRRRAAGWLGGMAAGTVLLGLLPFALANASDLFFSLVTYRGDLPLAGGSILALMAGTPVEGVARHADGLLVVAAVLSVAVLVARRRGPGIWGDKRATYGVLALVATCFPLLAKTVWPYYFLDPYVFLVVWTAASPALRRGLQSWRVLALPIAALGWSFFTLFAISSASAAADRIHGSVLLCALVCVVLAPLVQHLLWPRSETLPAREAAAAKDSTEAGIRTVSRPL
jgi:hypothetical protein